MELAELRASADLLRFPASHRREIYSRKEEQEEEEAHLRREVRSHDDPTVFRLSPVFNMLEYERHHHRLAAARAMSPTHADFSSYRRVPQPAPNVPSHRVSFESPNMRHAWARSHSVSSLSNSSCGSDSDAGSATVMKSSAKSSPIRSSGCSLNNYDFGQTDSGACSARTIASVDTGGETETSERRKRELSNASSPTAEELSEVFSWVDENNDGLICGSDLRGFMSRVLAFEISEDEAETLLLVYGNGRTLCTNTSPSLRRSGGAVVDFEEFLGLYQCLCGEPVSPEEQSMMAQASQLFDETQLQSGRWV